MSGRAGRRGIDKKGYVIIIENNHNNLPYTDTLKSIIHS